MNINGISVRFCGDVHLPRCRGKRGMTNSFGSHEDREGRQGGIERERGEEVVLMKRSRVEKWMVGWSVSDVRGVEKVRG